MNTENNNRDFKIKTHWSAYMAVLIVPGGLLLLVLYVIVTKPEIDSLGSLLVFFSAFTVAGVVFAKRSISINDKELLYKHWPFKVTAITLSDIKRIEIRSGPPDDDEPRNSANGTLRLHVYNTQQKRFIINFMMFDDKELPGLVKYLALRIPGLELNDHAKEVKDANLKVIRLESIGYILEQQFRRLFKSNKIF